MMPDQSPSHDPANASVGATGSGIAGDIRTPQRHDSAHKHVAGTAVYVDDIPTPDNTLVVLIGQSPHAHARIAGIDVSKVVAADGVVALSLIHI